MKFIKAWVFLMIIYTGAGAQVINNVQQRFFKVSGKVTDSASGQFLEKATITLTGLHNIKYQALSDNKGFFTITRVPAGTYTLSIAFIGYTTWFNNSLVFDSSSNPQRVFDAALKKKGLLLQTVVVTAPRALIENKIDKIIYNVEKDITSQGGVATDALKKIPQVTVDVDGNVELLGNPNILFLIDGKPSGIFANSVADALQSIPASQIQSIEVITSPSAKYDASGTGGIINIILKKSKIQGFSGNINLSAGSRLENGSLNAGWHRNNVGINAYYSGNAQLNALTPTGMDRLTTVTDGTKRLIQETAPNFSRNGYKSGLGIDWAVNKKNSLTTSFGYNHFATKNDGTIDQTFIQYDLTGNQISTSNSTRDFTNNFSVNTFDNSLSFKHKFKKDKQELELSYSGSFSRNTTFYDQTQYYKTSSTAFAGATSLNPGIENSVTLSIDYAHPIKDNALIETGFMFVSESIISNADVLTLDSSTGSFSRDLTQSYNSDYHRKVYAGYLVASFSLFKFLDIKAGGRYEYTVGRANYSNTGDLTLPAYHNLAPSFVVSHSFSNNQTLKLSYSYRIERPDYRDLNPFMNLADPHNIITGNPNLQPEIGHNWQLGYTKSFDNGANLNFLVFYERNSPDIKPYITYYPNYKIGDSVYTDVTVTSRANISAEEKKGINISFSLPLGKKLTLRPNIMLYDRYLNNIYDTPPTLHSLGFRTNINATWQPNGNWVAEAFGNYNLGMKWQGKQPSLFSYTVAMRRQLFHNKGSIGFVVVNAFNKYIVQKSLVLSQNLVTNNYRNIPYRSVGISFTYKFGKLKFTKTKDADNYLYTPPAEN